MSNTDNPDPQMLQNINSITERLSLKNAAKANSIAQNVLVFFSIPDEILVSMGHYNCFSRAIKRRSRRSRNVFQKFIRFAHFLRLEASGDDELYTHTHTRSKSSTTSRMPRAHTHPTSPVFYPRNGKMSAARTFFEIEIKKRDDANRKKRKEEQLFGIANHAFIGNDEKFR